MDDFERVAGFAVMITISLVVPVFQSSWGILQDDMISRVYCPDTGHEYALIEVSLPWREARVFCKNLEGHLVTIGSASENNFVENLADPIDDDVWIGLSDERIEGTWEWVTEERIMYANWEDNKPDGGDYVEMHRDGTWNDLPVTSSMYFVCEWSEWSDESTTTTHYQNSKPEYFPPIVDRILLFLFFGGATLGMVYYNRKKGNS